MLSRAAVGRLLNLLKTDGSIQAIYLRGNRRPRLNLNHAQYDLSAPIVVRDRPHDNKCPVAARRRSHPLALKVNSFSAYCVRGTDYGQQRQADRLAFRPKTLSETADPIFINLISQLPLKETSEWDEDDEEWGFLSLSPSSFTFPSTPRSFAYLTNQFIHSSVPCFSNGAFALETDVRIPSIKA